MIGCGIGGFPSCPLDLRFRFDSGFTSEVVGILGSGLRCIWFVLCLSGDIPFSK